MIKVFDTLYAVAKTGKTLKFHIQVEKIEFGAEITQATGQVGGKQVIKTKTI